jgi:hypothetical protein
VRSGHLHIAGALCWGRTDLDAVRGTTIRRFRATSFVLVAAVALLAMAGCSGRDATLSTTWPRADSERVVPLPPTPPRWPLTGLDAPSRDALAARIVAVKIENSPAARPQSGLDKADVVYETLTEGGITRFIALFQSSAPAIVGPVRSARASDLWVVQQYRAVFAHVGGERALLDEFRRLKLDDLDQYFNPAPYWRTTDRPAPHNVYTDISKLRSHAVVRGMSATQTVTALRFDRAPVTATPTVSAVSIPFDTANVVEWRYDAATRTFVRFINGQPHVDKASGQQYRAENVVVMWARTQPRTHVDANGVRSLDIILGGTGQATVLRAGVRAEGTWEAGADAPPAMKAADGRPIGLSPGRTWFEVVALSTNIAIR